MIRYLLHLIAIMGFAIGALGIEAHRLYSQRQDNRMMLQALLSCASNHGFILYLEHEIIDVDCVRAPSWDEYSVADRRMLKLTSHWIQKRHHALEHLRNSKPPQMGRMVISRTPK